MNRVNLYITSTSFNIVLSLSYKSIEGLFIGLGLGVVLSISLLLASVIKKLLSNNTKPINETLQDDIS